MWIIKEGDWLATVNRKPDFLGKRIQEFQRVNGFKEPACLATHAEIVKWVTPSRVCTFSQTFPKAKEIVYNFDDLSTKLNNGSRFLFRIQEYDKVVTDAFRVAVALKMKDIEESKPKGWAKWFPVNYDVLQLPNQWINWVAGLFRYKKYVNWLEIPGGLGVCSDKAAEVLDAGFYATWGHTPIFPRKVNAEVWPADPWKEPMFYEVKAN